MRALNIFPLLTIVIFILISSTVAENNPAQENIRAVATGSPIRKEEFIGEIEHEELEDNDNDIEPGCDITLNIPFKDVGRDSAILPRAAKILQHFVEYIICYVSLLIEPIKNKITGLLLSNPAVSKTWTTISDKYDSVATSIYEKFGDPSNPTKSFTHGLGLSIIFAWTMRFRPQTNSAWISQLYHIYVSIAGIFIACVTYGPNIYHHFISLMMTFATLKALIFPTFIFGSAKFLWSSGSIFPYYCLGVAAMGALAQLLYFLYLRKENQTEENDLDFCTGQMLLCLRHMGLIIDVYDRVTYDNPSAGPQKRYYAYRTTPVKDFFPVVGYTFAPFLYFSGPVIPFMEYNDYVNAKEAVAPWGPKDTLQTLLNVAGGSVFFAIDLFIKPKVSVTRVPEIAASKDSAWYKGAYMFLSVFLSVFQYYAIWSFGEAIGVIGGMVAHASHRTSERRFNDNFEIIRSLDDPILSTNAYPIQNLFSTNFQDLMNTWNFNVNKWAQYYVLKRVGLKTASMFVMTTFLAIWHGTHAGYFIFFSAEFFEGVIREISAGWIDELHEILPKQGGLSLLAPLVYFFQWFSTRFYAFNMVLAFFLLDVDKWWRAMQAINYAPFWYYLGIFILGIPLKMFKGLRKFKLVEDQQIEHPTERLKGYIASSLNYMSGLLGGDKSHVATKRRSKVKAL